MPPPIVWIEWPGFHVRGLGVLPNACRTLDEAERFAARMLGEP